MRDYKNIIKEAELLASSPEAVVAYLKERDSRDGDDALEDTLLELNNPLIDLALAQYGRSLDVLKTLFHRGQLALRVAVLANQAAEINEWCYRWPFNVDLKATGKEDLDSEQFSFQEKKDLIKAYLTDASDEEICALFENPKLGLHFLKDFLDNQQYAYWGAWDALNENKQQIAVMALKGNENLKPLLGWLPSTFEIEADLYSSAWKLADRVPVTARWAVVLNLLYESLPPQRNSFVYINNPLKLASRWHPTKQDDIEIENKEIVSISCFYCFQKIRYNLAKIAIICTGYARDIDALLASEDIAFRAAAYSCADLTLKQITKAYKKDPKLAFDALVNNPYLWMREEKREALNKICFFVGRKGHGNPFPRKKFNTFWEKFEKEHPEWFQTEEDKLKESATKGDLEKLTEHMMEDFKDLTSQIKNLENGLKYVLWLAVLLIIIDQYF